MKYFISWPDNSWRPMVFKDLKDHGTYTSATVPWVHTRATIRRCWREIRREVHLVRFGRYPTGEKWKAFS